MLSSAGQNLSTSARKRAIRRISRSYIEPFGKEEGGPTGANHSSTDNGDPARRWFQAHHQKLRYGNNARALVSLGVSTVMTLLLEALQGRCPKGAVLFSFIEVPYIPNWRALMSSGDGEQIAQSELGQSSVFFGSRTDGDTFGCGRATRT
jgi:hypothetical protein